MAITDYETDFDCQIEPMTEVSYLNAIYRPSVTEHSGTGCDENVTSSLASSGREIHVVRLTSKMTGSRRHRIDGKLRKIRLDIVGEPEAYLASE